MTFLARIFGGKRERDDYRPLYDAIVNAGRSPEWYVAGQVPDTVDGRFDMISAVLALTLIRLEQDDAQTRRPSVLLTEIFIDDMDGSVRQLGIGDLVVGALGGRLAAFRTALEGDGDLTAAVRRNIFHDAVPNDDALAFVASRLRELHERLQSVSSDELLKGNFPG
jgi:cytochrome b pre-mRNA-processing protein 3